VSRVISATEARIRFGELLRRVVDLQEAVVVERGGTPQVVVLSVGEYERLKSAGGSRSWEVSLKRAARSRDRIAARREGRPLSPPDALVVRARAVGGGGGS